MQNAALSRFEKSLVTDGARGNFGFLAVAKRTRRLLVSRGGAARREVLVSADFDLSSEEETDSEA